MTNGPVVVDDVPNCAQPNKSAKQAIYGTHATRSKGKIPTGKGKKSRKSLKMIIGLQNLQKRL